MPLTVSLAKWLVMRVTYVNAPSHDDRYHLSNVEERRLGGGVIGPCVRVRADVANR